MIDLIILIPILIQILIWLGIIGAAVWIWKNKKWPKSKKAAITLALAIGILIGFYAIFAFIFILVSSDQANYS